MHTYIYIYIYVYVHIQESILGREHSPGEYSWIIRGGCPRAANPESVVVEKRGRARLSLPTGLGEYYIISNFHRFCIV